MQDLMTPPARPTAGKAAPLPRPHPLTPSEVEASRRRHGDNRLSRKPRRGFWRQFLSNLGDPVIRILLCALGLNLLFAFRGGTDWFETGGIALAVFLATLISTLSEHGSEAAYSRLSESCGRMVCRVRRADTSGREGVCEIPTEEIVVGDIVTLSPGEMIPADGILLAGRLAVDQSSMTGESREVTKTAVGKEDIRPDRLSPADPAALLRGCTVLSGQGEMLTLRVGDKTVLGEISDEVQTDTRESPLKLRLARLATQISRLGYVAAALVALIFLVNAFLFDTGFDKVVILEHLSDWRWVWSTCFHAATLGLTVLVVAVPEGLPMMIAVVLSSNIRKMVKDQVLVRKPVGIEAAGSMNILFTDKTGTLTEGVLSISRILTGDGREYADTAACATSAAGLYAHIADACMTNTQSVAGTPSGEGGVSPARLRALGGNATDRALLDGVLASPPLPTPPHSSVLARLPFDSANKYAAALVERDGETYLYVKGAPERLLPWLSSGLSADGHILRRADGFDRVGFEKRIRDLTRTGGRVLLMAQKKLSVSGGGRLSESAMTPEGGGWEGLSLVCGVLLADKLRPEAPSAVRTLRRAGIHVVMMTGDNRDTAHAIAESCGILGGGVDLVLESRELADMTDIRLRELLPRIGVISRALPTDKSRLVRLAQEAELVVGMTGDGINDAPALKRADIGFAMGAGTQVARDAGDIIILDNNLSSISRAVLYGRTIFKSIRKFITLQLTMNLCAVGVSMICPFIGVDAPVTVVQMLWINLIMDTLGGLAFAGEAPLPSYMKERPKRRDEPILNRYMIHEIAWLGGFTVGLCLLFLKLPGVAARFRTAPDNIYLMTAFFALFIFASVFNCFNARTDRLNPLAGLSDNPTFTVIMTAVLLVQIIFVYVGGAVLRTAPLTLSELGFTSLCALSVFPVELARKLWRRLRGKEEGY